MPVINYLQRFERMDSLIRREGTGNAKQFAEKIGVSRKMIYLYIETMKELGAPIKYDICNKTYYYSKIGALILNFVNTSNFPAYKQKPDRDMLDV